MNKIVQIFLLLGAFSFIQAVILPCQFNNNSDECKILNLKLKEKDEEVTDVTGRHAYRKTNDDVTEIWFTSGLETEFMPTNFCKFFANIKRIDVFASEISHISRLTFKFCVKITKVYITQTSLTQLDEDLFADLPELTLVYLSQNKLVSLPEDLIKYNPKLMTFVAQRNALTVIDIEFPESTTFVDLSDNKCINKSYMKANLDDLKEFNREVATRCENPMKQTIITHKNEVKKLQAQIAQLEQDKNDLEVEKANLGLNISSLMVENEKCAKINDGQKAELDMIKTNNTKKMAEIAEENIKVSAKYASCEREYNKTLRSLDDATLQLSSLNSTSAAKINALQLNLTATDRKLRDNLAKVELLSAQNKNAKSSLEECRTDLAAAHDNFDVSQVQLEDNARNCNETIAGLRGKLAEHAEALTGETSRPSWLFVAILTVAFASVLAGTVVYMRRKLSTALVTEIVNHSVSITPLIIE